jgi:REase_DpnII-MboI
VTNSQGPWDDQFGAVMLFIADRYDLRHGSFGVFSVLPAVPTIGNDDLRKLVSSAVSQGFLKDVEVGRFQITLEGLRRAEAARYRKGGTSRLPFEWSDIPGFTFGDAVLVHVNRSHQQENVYIEDLYVEFALTTLDALKVAVCDLRDSGYLRAPNDEGLKILRRLRAPSTGALDLEWVSVLTADGLRRATELESTASVMPTAVEEMARRVVRSLSQPDIEPENEIAAMLRAIPLALRELDAKNRRKGGVPFKVENEYDLQDFVRAMLRARFPTLIAEDAVQTLAGRGGRVDFRLKDERIYIELKVFRDMSHWKQSMYDDISSKIQRYGRQHDCDVLFIFVYDPLTEFTEAESAERDFSYVSTMAGKKVDVRLIVAPKH